MIRWVFFDVGNVVMNDDPVMAFIYDELFQAIDRTGSTRRFEDLLEERERIIRENGAGHWYVLGERYLGVDGLHRLMHECASRIRADYMAFHNVLPGMADALEVLAREVSLGILANQLKEVVDGFQTAGLRHLFRILAVSELIGLKKPEPAIFQWALERAECRPEEALMVGDRIDNDIVPAKTVGMWTLWFHAPLEAKGYAPPAGRACLYFESQKRASIAEIGPARPEQVPDGEARSAESLLTEFSRLQALSRSARPGGASAAGASVPALP